jgi:hypothetical protein
MKFLIQVAKNKPAIDYTRYVVDGSANLQDSINVPTLFSFQLSNVDAAFVPPPRGSYITVQSEIFPNKILFTGFITSVPERSFLGLSEASGVQIQYQLYNYNVHATSDEWLINCNTVSFIPAFVNQTDTQILQSIATALAPGIPWDFSGMATGTLVPYYQYDPAQTFSDIAKTFADQNRYYYKVINKKIIYQPFGDAPLGIAYDDQNMKERQLAPAQLRTNVVTVPPVNDCIVLGDTEPQTNWDNYFIGDGFTSNFQLRHQVFQGTSLTLLQDDWTEASFTQGTWTVNDPLGVEILTDSNGNALGALNIVQKGLTGVYLPVQNATYIQAQNGLELGGGLNLQHGSITFNDACNGLIGSVFGVNNFIPGNVLCGFGITGQQNLGTFAVSGVQIVNGNTQLVNLIIAGTAPTNILPGNVLNASLFTNASFLNGHVFTVVSVTQGTGSWTLIVQSSAIYANPYGPTADTGQISFPANAVFVTASGAAGIVIQPIFSGAYVGQPIVTQVNHQYTLQTWIGAGAPTRFTRPYTNLTQTATYGAQNLTSSGTITWVITDVSLGQYVIEQRNPLFGLFPAAPPPVVTKFSLTNINLPPFGLYCLVNCINLNCSINYTLLSLPPQGYLTVQSLTGASGGNLPWLPSQLSAPIVYQLGVGQVNQSAQISQQGEVFELSFYTDDIPSVGARIRFQSWAAGQSVARVTDPIAIANEAVISGDNGVRAAIMLNLSPLPRTSAECEAAAAAAILDREYPQFQGTYTVQTIPNKFESLYAPSLYDYPRTGRFLYINSPNRGITGQNFYVNTVTIQLIELRQEVMTITVDYGPDLYLEKLLPAFLERDQNVLTPKQTVQPPNPITLPQVLNAFLPTLDNAVIVNVVDSLTGNYVTVNLGAPPITACEVRNVDSGWGIANQGRVGLFTVPVFTLPRTSRDQTWYLRTLNGSQFSRFSKALRVQYPLIPNPPTLVSSDASKIVTDYAGDVRDIYGLELRALSSSGFAFQEIVEIPNTNPSQLVYQFYRDARPNTFPPTSLFAETGQPTTTIYVLAGSFVGGGNNQIDFIEGDIVYATCPTDASFNGFRIIAASGVLSVLGSHGVQSQTNPFVGTIEYGPPYPDIIGSSLESQNSSVGTLQLVSRNGYNLLASGSIINGIGTVYTQGNHGFTPGQTVVIGAWYGANPTFIAPFSQALTNGAVFSTTVVVLATPTPTSFTYATSLAGGVQLVPLVGLVAGFSSSVIIASFIPGAQPGTLIQRPVFAPSDLVIDLTQPDIATALGLLEALTPGSRIGGLAVYFFNLQWDYSLTTVVPSFTVPSISGLAVEVQSQNLTWGLATGLPDGHRVETFDVSSGVVLSKYTVDHPSNPQLLKQSPLPAADWLSPRLIKVTPFDGLGDGIPSVIVWGGSSGIPVIGGGGGGAAIPQNQAPWNSVFGFILPFDTNSISNQNVACQSQVTFGQIVPMIRMVLPVECTFSSATIFVSSVPSSTGHFSCGIYSIDGTTLLANALFSIVGPLANENVTATFPPVTLPAGAYWFAFTTDILLAMLTHAGFLSVGANNPPTASDFIDWFRTGINNAFTNFAIAFTVPVGGALPASTGGIVPWTYANVKNTSIAIPYVLFQ